MWLDRFSAHSTPSGTPPPRGQSYSPAPRRPYQASGPGPLPPRPGINPRSSSLSLVSPSSSSTSLPSTSRLPNGAGRRRQGTGGVPPNVSDPLQVLEAILGRPPRKPPVIKGDEIAEPVPKKPEEVVEDIDFGGLSLQEFAAIESDTPEIRHSSPVHTYSTQSVEEYDKEKDKFEDLHKSILACDEVLKSVEAYLTNFQSDLGAVSSEIESLQNRSIALNTKLENRKVVEKLLGPAVEDISISPAVVKKIAEGPVDEGFLRALAELEKRSKTTNAKAKEQPDVKALTDIKPLIDDLTDKAIERIRDYVVAQIKAIRSPSMNAQIIQQQAFLKYKDLYAFLARHQPQLSQEIAQAYIYTMRWYYLNHFTRYRQALEKLKLQTLDKHDVLGEDSSAKRGPLLGNNRTLPPSHEAFSLGRRFDHLKNPSPNALTAYLAEEEKGAHYLEVPFRSFNLAIIDNASFEYTFLTTYFSPSQNYHAISRTFASIFEPTLSLGQSLTKQLTESTTDTLGILLCVRLNQHFAFELQRRKVPTVESYINATNMLLWPRFQQILDQHCTSLQKLTSSLPTRPSGGGAAALLSPSSSTHAQSTAPTPLTQKFANLLQGILALSSEAGDDEPVSVSVARLRSEFEAYLTRLSKGISDNRKRERFLCNNYSLVCTILADTEGRLGEEIRSHFEKLRDAFEK
ncbi:Vps52-domain-containing protein [Lindgomyces ingoldianus]|uniref:Vps52-domain-containing protein n=1 Tax=Lindgomyces ingoldianus TaxID=673940 RepID=A0ACB6R382_9PLEO|nr:Vps52-domain-containing protein [Lindgomyces ingoldianus]KAF2472896.1 Vps52-domain-containing protein [Lindgomyces ingoldianus]